MNCLPITINARILALRVALTVLVADEKGQDLIEYALVAALVGLGAVASMKGVSGKVGNSFNSIGAALTSNV